MSDDEYWDKNRSHYASLEWYAKAADVTQQKAIDQVLATDAIKRGVCFERGEPEFEVLLRIAEKRFGLGWCARADRISLEPHPWKSEGRWLMMVSGHGGIEGYVTTEEVLEGIATISRV